MFHKASGREHGRSLIHGISQATILEWLAISFSRWSSRPRDQIRIFCVSCIAGRSLPAEPSGKLVTFCHSINTPLWIPSNYQGDVTFSVTTCCIQSALWSSARQVQLMPGHDVKKQSMVKGPGAAWNGDFRQVIKILSQWHLSRDGNEEKISQEVGSWGWVRKKSQYRDLRQKYLFYLWNRKASVRGEGKVAQSHGLCRHWKESESWHA